MILPRFQTFPPRFPRPRTLKAGVSGFQIRFASTEIFTPGDQVDALVAMRPRGCTTTNLVDLTSGGILVVNKDAFDEKDGLQAG